MLEQDFPGIAPQALGTIDINALNAVQVGDAGGQASHVVELIGGDTLNQAISCITALGCIECKGLGIGNLTTINLDALDLGIITCSKGNSAVVTHLKHYQIGIQFLYQCQRLAILIGRNSEVGGDTLRISLGLNDDAHLVVSN